MEYLDMFVAQKRKPIIKYFRGGNRGKPRKLRKINVVTAETKTGGNKIHKKCM
jgi:hypothetical protein